MTDGWGKLRRAFYICGCIWIIGGLLIRLLLQTHQAGSSSYFLLIDVQSFVVNVFGSITIVSGVVLLGRWASNWIRNSRQRKAPEPKAKIYETPVREPATIIHTTGADRWRALVLYDEEIREAAQKLRPFGNEWINRLGEDFFALREERQYLPTIVDRLTREAERQNVERRLARFRHTSAGEALTEEAGAILLRAEQEGYILGVQEDKTITVQKGTSKAFLRSNAEVLRYGQFLPRAKV